MSYNYPYNLFSPNYLNSYDQQLYEKQRQHLEQMENLQDLQKAASDFLDACDKVRPEYQSDAQQVVLNAIMMHMMKKKGRGQL